MSADCMQWQVMLVDKPLKKRGKPVVTMYVVAASSREEAQAHFEQEMPGHLGLTEHYAITPCDCRVMPSR